MNLVVFIEGGCVQQILTDGPDCEVLLVDWDWRNGGDAPGVVELTDTSGAAMGEGLVALLTVDFDPSGVEHFFHQVPKDTD